MKRFLTILVCVVSVIILTCLTFCYLQFSMGLFDAPANAENVYTEQNQT